MRGIDFEVHRGECFGFLGPNGAGKTTTIFYQPQNSIWYFPQAYKLTEHGKYLLMAPSKDRAGTLGFRCVVDAQ